MSADIIKFNDAPLKRGGVVNDANNALYFLSSYLCHNRLLPSAL